MKKLVLVLSFICLCLLPFNPADAFATDFTDPITMPFNGPDGITYNDYAVIDSGNAPYTWLVFFNKVGSVPSNPIANYFDGYAYFNWAIPDAGNGSGGGAGYICNGLLVNCDYVSNSWGSFWGGSFSPDATIYTTRDVLNTSLTGSVRFAANRNGATNPPLLSIIINPLEGGNVTGTDISCNVNTSSDCQYQISQGTQIALTAHPSGGWSFSHWTVGTSNYSDNPHTFTVNSNTDVKAVFRLLSFPLAGYTPYTVPVSAVFDHTATGEYTSDTNNHVTAFNGEFSDNATAYQTTTCYAKDSNHNYAFGLGFNYTGVTSLGGVNYLCYNGHPGFDYAVSCNTPVYAATNGVVHIPTGFPGYLSAQDYNTVEVDHADGYKTYYLHLNTQNVTDGQPVCAGDLIGYSGDVGASGSCHLHFEVQKSDIPVDPYGWTDSETDPYARATSINIWK